VAQSEELSLHLPTVPARTQDSRFPSQDLNSAPRKQEAGLLPSRPRRSCLDAELMIKIRVG
jgi:hypothetical protein